MKLNENKKKLFSDRTQFNSIIRYSEEIHT